MNGSKVFGLDHLKRLRVRWPLALCVFGVLFTCVVALVLWLPDKYESRLKVAVKNDRSEPQINTEIQLLTGNKVLGEVVKSSHLDDLIAMEGSPQVRKEAAVQQLQTDLVVTRVRNSNVIEMSYESTDAKRSAEVLNAVWQSYNLVNRRMHGAPGSLGYFERLSAEYDDQLAQAKADLAKFRADHGITAPPAEQQKSTASSARWKQENKNPAIDRHPQNQMQNQAQIRKLSSLLVSLQSKRYEWGLQYQPGDPLLLNLDAEIARARALLTQAKISSASEASVAANPASDAAQNDSLLLDANSDDAPAQSDELARLSASASLSKADAAENKQLMRKVSDLEELDQSYHKKVQQMGPDRSQDQQTVSNLAIVDEPFTPTTPSSPRRGLILSLGFLCSLLIALIAVAVVESLEAKGFQIGSVTSSRTKASSTRRSTSTARSPHSVSQRARHRSNAPTIVVPVQEPQPFEELDDETLQIIDSVEVEPGTIQLAVPEPIQYALHDGTDPDSAAEQGALVHVAPPGMQAPRRPVPEPLPISAPICSPTELGETTGLPLLATVSAASFRSVSKSFSAVYLAVQRGKIAPGPEARQ